MELFDNLYDVTVGLLLLGGLGSLLFTLPKVTTWWKPIYIFSIPLTLVPLGMLVFDFFLMNERSPEVKLLVFLWSLQLIAVPFVHRLEARHLDIEGKE